jgi:hypothetical protein
MPTVAPALRRALEGLRMAQEEIRDALAQLSDRFETPEIPRIHVTRGQVDR